MQKEAVKGIHHNLTGIDDIFKTASCSVCGTVDIYWDNKSWICSVAKLRRGRTRLLTRYGLNNLEIEIVEKTVVCDLCRLPFKSSKDKHIDHDHISNKFRGILCHACNIGLGHFKDSVENLAKAIQYLENFRSGNGSE